MHLGDQGTAFLPDGGTLPGGPYPVYARLEVDDDGVASGELHFACEPTYPAPISIGAEFDLHVPHPQSILGDTVNLRVRLVDDSGSIRGYILGSLAQFRPRAKSKGSSDFTQPRDEPDDDWKFARLAIEEARKTVAASDGKVHPRVGAVVVKNGEVLSTAHRGEVPDNHAEYIALEVKLPDDVVAGATIYTTLEPCTTRNHPKIPCANRLVERKVARVVIGMLDPNPRIRGLGQLFLREANIETQLFPSELMSQVEDLNRDFIRAQKITEQKPDQQKVESRRNAPIASVATDAKSRNKRIEVVALIVAILALLAVWLVVPEFRRWTGLDSPEAQNQSARKSISGIVVEQDTNRGIGQATITLAGRTERDVTVDSGNFRIDLPPDSPKRLRLRVSKDGFEPLDTSVEPPVDNLVLPLHKQ